MVLAIKTKYAIRKSLPISFKIILNALVLSRLHYSAVVIQSIGKNLCVNRKTNQLGLDSFFLSVEIRVNQRAGLEHNILPIKLFIETERLLYFWKIKSGQLPAFSTKMGQSLPIWSIVQSRRTKNLFWNCKFKGQK